MSIQNQILVVFLMLFLVFWYLRGFFHGLKRYQLNKSAYKKRKEGETIKEWLLFSRYKEEIPAILRIFYHSVLLVHLASMAACTVIWIAKLPPAIGSAIPKAIMWFDTFWIAVIMLFFWSPRRSAFVYERWITKKRGQRKGKS